MRHGYWIILDELNLAPSDVLEALNRLLDDNRELLISETQETVKAHNSFLLFATQNPPATYGGRKVCIMNIVLFVVVIFIVFTIFLSFYCMSYTCMRKKIESSLRSWVDPHLVYIIIK